MKITMGPRVLVIIIVLHLVTGTSLLIGALTSDPRQTIRTIQCYDTAEQLVFDRSYRVIGDPYYPRIFVDNYRFSVREERQVIILVPDAIRCSSTESTERQ